MVAPGVNSEPPRRARWGGATLLILWTAIGAGALLLLGARPLHGPRIRVPETLRREVHDPQHHRDAGEEPTDVRGREAVRQERLARAAEADDAPGTGVRHEETGRCGVREAGELRLHRRQF